MRNRTFTSAAVGLAAGLCSLTAATPAHASTPGEGGATWVTAGCSSYKAGGMRHTSTSNPSSVTFYNAVSVRTCLRKSGTTMYAMTQWYMPNGGYVVGVVYAAVQDCANTSPSASYGSRTDGYQNPYYAGTTSSSTTATYGNNVYGTSGHSYRSRGYMGGDAEVHGVDWTLDDGAYTPNVSVYSGCYKI